MADKPTYEELDSIVKHLTAELDKHKQEKKVLLESEQRYLKIFKYAVDSIFIIDPSTGSFIDCNEKAAQRLGYTKEELLKLKVFDINIAEQRPEIHKRFKKQVDGESILFETTHLHKMGHEIPAEITSTLLDLKGQKILLSFVRYITERKRLEQELRTHQDNLEQLVNKRTAELTETNKKLQLEIKKRKRTKKAWEKKATELDAILSNMGQGIAYLDVNDTIIYLNRQCSNLFGIEYEEVFGKNICEFHFPESKEKIEKLIKEFRNGKQSLHLVETVHDRVIDNTFHRIESAEGSYQGILMSAFDITERVKAEEQRRKLEAQLQHAQKMESMGTLTSGVAHNFRNILSPISLYCQFIQMTYKDDPQLQEMAEKTIQCVKRGAQLVDGLMQFSRKHAKELETTNLAEVIRETYDLITKSFDKKIDIRMDIADSLPIRGDYSGLSQVFMNLCTNARDAMPDGGELSIKAGMEGGDALITISDTGHGMDEQTREQCFDPFFTTKEVDKGTGLGLSTAYGIVKDLGGEIHVFSELNKGTTFKLYFPLVLLDEHQRQAGIHEVVQGSGEKVLIIDDEVAILEVLVMLAEQLGYSAASADSGKAGIDKYKSWRPDVVLLDRNMPGMDGLKCARSILEYDPEARLVLISGYDEGGLSGIDDKTKALIKGYLTKPIKMDAVSQTIRKVLDQD